MGVLKNGIGFPFSLGTEPHRNTHTHELDSGGWCPCPELAAFLVLISVEWGPLPVSPRARASLLLWWGKGQESSGCFEIGHLRWIEEIF